MRFEGYLNENLKSDYLDVMDGKSSFNCDVKITDFSKFKNNYQEYQKRIQSENTTFNSLVADINASRLKKLAEEKRRKEEQLAKEQYEREHAEEIRIANIVKVNKKKEKRTKVFRFIISLLLIVVFAFYVYFAFSNYAYVEHFGTTGFAWIIVGAGLLLLAITFFTIKFNFAYSRNYSPQIKNNVHIRGAKKANFFAILSALLILVIAGVFVITKIGVDNLPYTIFDEKANDLLNASNKMEYEENEESIISLYNSYMSFSDSEKNKLKEKNNFEEYIYGYNTYKVNLVKAHLNDLNINNAESLLIKSINEYDSLIYAQKDMITSEMKYKYEYYLTPYNQVVYINNVYEKLLDKYDLINDVRDKYNLLSEDEKKFVYNKDLMDNFELAYTAYNNLIFELLGDDTYSVSAKQGFNLSKLVIPKWYNGKIISKINSLKNCSTLKELIVPNTINYISKGALNGCSGLTKVELPFIGTSKSPTRLDDGDGLFGSIFGSKSYNNSTSVSQHYDGTMGGYGNYYIPNNLTNVIINDSNKLYYGAFYGCNAVKNITISNSITNIDSHAFYNCNSSLKVYYIGDDAQWNKISIANYNTALTNASRYYYLEEEPVESGNYWHYVDGVIVEW